MALHLALPGLSLGHFVWQSPGLNVEQVFRFRLAGSTGAWETRTVTAPGDGKDDVDLSAIAAGTYDYELLWTHPGEGVPYAHATGPIARPASNRHAWCLPRIFRSSRGWSRAR